MCEAVFDCANQLFGLRFVHRPDISSYHPDVKTYEVRETVEGKDKLVGIFLHGKSSSNCCAGTVRALPSMSVSH
jgi:Zn-dependent oligopeptidase